MTAPTTHCIRTRLLQFCFQATTSENREREPEATCPMYHILELRFE